MTRFQYLWKNYKGEAIIVLVCSLVAICWVANTNELALNLGDMDSWYADWMDPIVTVGTFLVALFVWWDSKMQEWQNSLSKCLTVHFKWGKNYVMSACNLKLISEQDIRAFSQSIGTQFDENLGRLKMIPGITEKTPKTMKTKRGEYIRYYEVELYLTTPPPILNGNYAVWVLKRTNLKEVPDLPTDENDYVVTDENIIYKRERFPLEKSFSTDFYAFDPRDA